MTEKKAKTGDADELWQAAYARCFPDYFEWERGAEDKFPNRPDFLCIGAQKAGTSWLASNLPYHPSIWLPPIKEIGFFSSAHLPQIRSAALNHRREQIRGAREWWFKQDSEADLTRRMQKCLQILENEEETDCWYQSIFTGCGPDQLCGEITPEYSMLPRDGVRHALKLNPNLKAIAIIRDPAERALSHAKMLLGDLATENAVIALLNSSELTALRKYSNYPEWIGRWRSMLPAGNLLVVGTRQIARDPYKVLKRICVFLGAPFDADFFSAARKRVFIGSTIDNEIELHRVIKEKMSDIYEKISLDNEIVQAL